MAQTVCPWTTCCNGSHVIQLLRSKHHREILNTISTLYLGHSCAEKDRKLTSGAGYSSIVSFVDCHAHKPEEYQTPALSLSHGLCICRMSTSHCSSNKHQQQGLSPSPLGHQHTLCFPVTSRQQERLFWGNHELIVLHELHIVIFPLMLKRNLEQRSSWLLGDSMFPPSPKEFPGCEAKSTCNSSPHTFSHLLPYPWNLLKAAPHNTQKYTYNQPSISPHYHYRALIV